jgi:hypothetical protein
MPSSFYRKCRCCGITADTKEELELFRKDSKQPFGRRNECKECYAKNIRNWTLQSKYGITQEDYDVMLENQNNSCAICNTKETDRYGVFHVDHCHTTGKVRALLCSNCNQALGLFYDNSEALSKASQYVEYWKEVHYS